MACLSMSSHPFAFTCRPAGSGSILSVVTDDGSLALLDVSQPLAVRPSFKARQALLREVLSTHSTPATPTHVLNNTAGHISARVNMPAAVLPAGVGAASAAEAAAAAVAAGVNGGGGSDVAVPVVLLSPGPLGSSMLLKQPWVLLLRFLLQVRPWNAAA